MSTHHSDNHNGPQRGFSRTRRTLTSGCVLLVMCFWMAVVRGEINIVCAGEEHDTPPLGEKASKALSEAEVAKKVDALEKRIQIASAAENESTAKQMGVTLADLIERSAQLKNIQSVYERVLTAFKKKTSQEQAEMLLREKLGAELQIGLTKDPPYNLSFYDAILDDLDAAVQQKESTSLALIVSRRVLEDANARLKLAQKEWHSLRDGLKEVDETGPNQALEWDLNQAQLEKELAEALITLEKANHVNLSKEVKIAELKAQLAGQKVNWVRANLHFDEVDLNKQLGSLMRRRTELEKRIADLMRGHNQAEAAWVMAQKRFKAAAMQEKPDPAAEASLKEREAWLETYQAVLEQTEDMLRLLGHQEHVLRLRYALVNGQTQDEDLNRHREETDSHIRDISRLLNVQQSYQTNLQSRIAVLEKRFSEKDHDRWVGEHLQNQLKAMQKLSERRFEYVSMLLATEKMDRRLVEEIDLKLGRAPVKQRLMNIKGHIEKIWGFELWVIDDHSVTIRKLLVALFILIIGIFIAKYSLRAISLRLLSLTHWKETTASAIQKTLTYFAYLLILLFALRVVNVPLTAFAFLGGAIAIGVGFGAQNLINNFISGFIMMAERPISIGDLIEVEGILGKVEEIGARCTRIRTGENIHILVPNSSFLEKNITNWTLSDRTIRARIAVGVVYGSPVRKVEQLLVKAVTENEKVLKKPEPFVLFGDFGDNALIFEAHFWISVRQIIERRMIESSVRYCIDELFRDAGIVIAFPQRDVHLDAGKPLELRILEKD